MGDFAGRIMIPVYCDQRLVGVQGRTIFEGVEPKYLFAKGFRKSEFLFGFDLARSAKVVIVVEGVFDAMKGYPYAVASFGAGITDTQLKLLATHWNRCIFIPDSDEAGQIGTTHAIEWLSKYISVGVFPLQGYHDLGDIPFEKAQVLVRELQNWW
jgi:DNA primase